MGRKRIALILAGALSLLIVAALARGQTPPQGEPLEGYAHIYVNDPFGNHLELLQPISLRD